MSKIQTTDDKAKMNWDLARLMLIKYNILHSFHEEQLKFYLHLASPYTLPSSFAVSLETREVTFSLKSKEFHKVSDKRYVRRAKYSPFSIYYKIMLKRDEANIRKKLKMWTRNLLWKDTKVTIEYI